MRKVLAILLTTAVALSVLPASAQTFATPHKVSTPTKSAKKTTAAVSEAKTAGMVKGNVTGTTFTLGSKSGTYTVDASKARCTYKGKFFKLANLKGGNMVVVTGKATGKSIHATEVKITFIKSDKPATTQPVKKSKTGH